MILHNDLNITVDINKLKSFGFEIFDRQATLKRNVFFNSIYAVVTVDFPTQTTKFDMIDVNGDLYLPFYSNFYGVIDSVADQITSNFNELIQELKGENLIWH